MQFRSIALTLPVALVLISTTRDMSAAASTYASPSRDSRPASASAASPPLRSPRRLMTFAVGSSIPDSGVVGASCVACSSFRLCEGPLPLRLGLGAPHPPSTCPIWPPYAPQHASSIFSPLPHIGSCRSIQLFPFVSSGLRCYSRPVRSCFSWASRIDTWRSEMVSPWLPISRPGQLPHARAPIEPHDPRPLPGSLPQLLNACVRTVWKLTS